MKFLLFLLLGLFAAALSGQELALKADGEFSGRISHLNMDASLIRFHLEFENQKYLNKKDQLDFWDTGNPRYRCRGYIVGRAPDYILVKVPEFKVCQKYVNMSLGRYILFSSQDLANNILMGKEVYQILIKKQLALGGKMKRHEEELHQHIEKVNAVNQRYQVLKEKLEAEWRDQIQALDEDKTVTLGKYQATKNQLDDVNFKMEQYRIEDKNFVLDRWALDPRLYIPK